LEQGIGPAQGNVGKQVKRFRRPDDVITREGGRSIKQMRSLWGRHFRISDRQVLFVEKLMRLTA
jgi:hypothetical protein